MATIFRHRKGETLPVPDGSVPTVTKELFGGKIETCDFCGQPHASAYWRGEQVISVCQACALDALPRLIADAVAGEHGDQPGAIGHLVHALETVESRYWRAAAVAIHRGVQVGRQEMER